MKYFKNACTFFFTEENRLHGDVGRIPITGGKDRGWRGERRGEGRDKTETGMEQGMWVYMAAVAAAVGAG